ncbi:alpha/beta hydrolase [Candidatus Pacearchaeota archaeon]|nr:alpha/beta hydrolase [Candidatus Pacearchaeota archaeon]
MERERVSFRNSRDLEIVGILHTPEVKTDSIIIMSHGSSSNKDREKSVKAASAYAKSGIAALRFDFGGSGESYDSEISIDGQVDDLKSAIKFAKGQGYSNIGLQGDSLGGLVSILAYNSEITAMLLTAPVTAGASPSLLRKEGVSEELEEKGYIIKEKDGKQFKFPKEYFEFRKNVNQEEILSTIKCPVLIIHGNADETVPLENSKEAIKYLPEESKLEIIEGGTHKLDTKLDEVIPLSLNWFKKYL